LLFYCCYTFLLYPSRDWLHPNETADWLQLNLPRGFKGMIAMFRNWTGTIFYVMCELWSNIIFAMLLWGFTNQVTKLTEASRFYAILGVGANFSGVVAGYISVLACHRDYTWDQSITTLTLIITGVGLLTMVLFRWFNRAVLTDSRFYDPEETFKDIRSSKGKISMRACIRYLLSSKYLIYLAVIVLAYNSVINLVEVLWKHEVHALYNDAKDYNHYMNTVSMIIGAISTLCALFVSGNLIRKLGWSFTAMMTPVILLVTSVFFFGAFFLNEYYPDVLLMTGFAPAAVVVFFGTLQNMLSRGAKYTVFDATREMAFVPLTPECKIKGKAVVDGLCSRLGKSGGSVAYQTLLIIFSTIPEASPMIAVILFSVIGFWTGSTYLLGKEFNRVTGKSESLEGQPA
jgi:AAA family ATP:ADP antiporter